MEAFIYKKWRPKEADGPESAYSILVKKDKLWRHVKTKEKGVWTRVGKLWESDLEAYGGN